MHFIITRFLTGLARDYGITYDAKYADNTIKVRLRKVPKNLIKLIENLTFDYCMGESMTIVNNKQVSKVDIQKFNVCNNVVFIDDEYGIVDIVFTTKNYGYKVNAIDAALHNYMNNHSIHNIVAAN